MQIFLVRIQHSLYLEKFYDFTHFPFHYSWDIFLRNLKSISFNFESIDSTNIFLFIEYIDLFTNSPQTVQNQECIPVGCVLPAHWSYLRISSYPMHAPQEQPCTPQQQPCTPPGATMHAPLGATTHAPWQQPHMPPPRATMHAPPEQPCMPPSSNHAHPPREQPCMPPQSNHTSHPRSNHRCPPHVDRQTPVKT